MKKISIFGIGSFGYAVLRHLDKHLDKKKYDLHAYDVSPALRQSLDKDKIHLIHHRKFKIDENVKIDHSVKEFINGTDILVVAVSSNAIKEVVKSIKPHINKDIIILNCAKAVDSQSGERFSEIINKMLRDIKFQNSLAVLAGGTIARDLFYSEPLGIDIASTDLKVRKVLQKIFVSENLNVYTTDDVVGVEYASAFKNVISILAGMIKGLGFSYGSETHMISRLAGEVERLVVNELGGKKKTFSISSQCWGNDMWMSATGNTRNREFGELLGRGFTSKKALEKMKKENKTVEGVNTLKVINKFIKGKEKKYPIFAHLNEMIFNEKNAKETILYLMHSNKI